MRKLLLSICSLLLIVFSSGCAMMFSGTTDRIVVNSTPTDADVYVNGDLVGKTGKEIILHRKYQTTRPAEIRKDGFEPLAFSIDQKVTPAYWLNVPLCLTFLVPGAIGFAVDISTGACMQPKQLEYNRVLVPKK